MMLPEELQQLHRVYLQEGRSLLQYVRFAKPYAVREERPRLVRLQEIVQSQGDILLQIGEQLRELRQPQSGFGNFPSEFTNYNYFDLRKLMPILVAEQTDRIAQLKQANSKTVLVAALLERKEVHLTEISKWLI